VRFRRRSPIRQAAHENKIQEFGVGSQFRILYDRIETPGGGLIIFQGMVDATAALIKSLVGYNIAWMEEALEAGLICLGGDPKSGRNYCSRFVRLTSSRRFSA
jgi:hypothetical protein